MNGFLVNYQAVSRPSSEQPLKNILAFVMTFCLFGCASTATPVDPEYMAVARLALGDTERTPGADVIVASPDISAKAKSALVALGRTVVTEDAIPHAEHAAKMPHYLFLRKFDVSAEDALFQYMSGVDKACGVGAKVLMSRKSGAWAVVTNSVSVCTVR